mgnify:CR=1 FL=1
MLHVSNFYVDCWKLSKGIEISLLKWGWLEASKCVNCEEGQCMPSHLQRYCMIGLNSSRNILRSQKSIGKDWFYLKFAMLCQATKICQMYAKQFAKISHDT